MPEVGESKEEVYYDYPVELTEQECIIFFEYARKHISEDEFETLMIEWALENIINGHLKGLIDEFKSTEGED